MKQTYKARFPVTDLEPHPDNPRRGDVDKIAESIDAHGFFGAVLVQESRNRIIAGEHRWKAAQAKGLATVPVILADVDDDEALRIMLSDNRTADAAGYDDPILLSVLSGLDDLTGTGYTDDDMAALAAASDTSGFAPVGNDEQPRLDQRAAILCPQCAFEWRVGPGGEIEPL